ncbi:hypothetical protein IAT40_007161 [Kwoniella sp. CBS 6097]
MSEASHYSSYGDEFDERGVRQSSDGTISQKHSCPSVWTNSSDFVSGYRGTSSAQRSHISSTTAASAAGGPSADDTNAGAETSGTAS